MWGCRWLGCGDVGMWGCRDVGGWDVGMQVTHQKRDIFLPEVLVEAVMGDSPLVQCVDEGSILLVGSGTRDVRPIAVQGWRRGRGLLKGRGRGTHKGGGRGEEGEERRGNGGRERGNRGR